MKPTYRILNKQLTIAGCDRPLFICALTIGGGIFMALQSVVVAATVFGCFAVMGWLRVKDPVAMRLLFNSGKFQPHYDAGVREPFLVIPKGATR